MGRSVDTRWIPSPRAEGGSPVRPTRGRAPREGRSAGSVRARNPKAQPTAGRASGRGWDGPWSLPRHSGGPGSPAEHAAPRGAPRRHGASADAPRRQEGSREKRSRGGRAARGAPSTRSGAGARGEPPRRQPNPTDGTRRTRAEAPGGPKERLNDPRPTACENSEAGASSSRRGPPGAAAPPLRSFVARFLVSRAAGRSPGARDGRQRGKHAEARRRRAKPRDKRRSPTGQKHPRQRAETVSAGIRGAGEGRTNQTTRGDGNKENQRNKKGWEAL